jgi:hypothetical protein
MFVSSVSVEQELISDAEQRQWPFTIPCVAAIAESRAVPGQVIVLP